jgi:hypothetical protein
VTVGEHFVLWWKFGEDILLIRSLLSDYSTSEHEAATHPIQIIDLGELVVCRGLFTSYVDRICGLVVRVPGYRSRGPSSIPGATRFFWEVVGLERSPLSLASTTEELLGRKSSGSGLENRDYGRRGSAALTTRQSSIRKKNRTNFADKQRSLGRYSSLLGSGHTVFFYFLRELQWRLCWSLAIPITCICQQEHPNRNAGSERLMLH